MPDFTKEEREAVGDILDEFNEAARHLTRAAELLKERGFAHHAGKALDLATAANAQKYLVVQAWHQRPGKAA